MHCLVTKESKEAEEIENLKATSSTRTVVTGALGATGGVTTGGISGALAMENTQGIEKQLAEKRIVKNAVTLSGSLKLCFMQF